MENLKNGTKIRDDNADIYVVTNTIDRIVRKDIDSPLLEDFTLDYLMYTQFEILSDEEKEIDIDSIEELYTNNIKSVGESETKCWTGRNLDIAFANKINELIKAIKQLNKKIGE